MDQRTGVTQLDALLGAIPEGSALLLVNDPGIEGEPFLYQAAYEAIQDGRDVLYLTTNRAPDSILRSMAEFDFRAEPRDLDFIDVFSGGFGLTAGARFTVSDPKDLGEFTRTLEAAADEAGDSVLLVDALSHLLDNAEVDEVAGYLPRIVAALHRFPLSISLLIRWPYADDLEGLFEPFDGVVRLRGVEGRLIVSQYFNVDRADWVDELDRRPRLFKALRPGGVHVYVPKIVVTGPYNAGKSTFVHSVSDDAVSVDRLGTTVALDHGHVEVNGVAVDVFGTPGQSRFDPILRVIGEHGVGVILVVDASKPEGFDRAREMMRDMWRLGMPAMVLANKQDLPGALSADEVAKRLNLPASVPTVPCTGSDPDEARAALQVLLDQILASDVLTDPLAGEVFP